MKLSQVIISRAYGSSGYNGQIKYESDVGNVEIKLTPAMLDPILKIVGEALIDTSRTVASTLTTTVIDSVKAIESPAILIANEQGEDDDTPF